MESVGRHLETVVLVQGCPRSGTTLLNRILNTHPNIAITNELDLVELTRKLKKIVFSKSKSFAKNKIIRAKSEVEDWNLSDFNALYPTDYRVVERFLVDYCGSIKDLNNCLIVGDKTPTYYQYDPNILKEMFPNHTLKIIQLSRSFSEVQRSIRWRTRNALRGTDTWKSVLTDQETLMHWNKAWNARREFRRYFGTDFLDLSYHGMLNRPENVCRIVADFLEVEDKFQADFINGSSTAAATQSSQEAERWASASAEILMPEDYSQKLLPEISVTTKVERKLKRFVITTQKVLSGAKNIN